MTTPPELFAGNELKIGTPKSSAFNGQSESLNGMALPDLETAATAGATLNAVGLTRNTEKRFPDFALWNVEADRVEPRLDVITHPHSN